MRAGFLEPSLRSSIPVALVSLLAGVGATLSQGSLAVPLEVEALGATYTTFVHTKVGDAPLTREVSRTLTSSTPISDRMYDEAPWGGTVYSAEATATADLFEISAFGRTRPWFADASAKFEMTFSPLSDASQVIEIQFAKYLDWFYSEGFVTLVDRTVDEGFGASRGPRVKKAQPFRGRGSTTLRIRLAPGLPY